MFKTRCRAISLLPPDKLTRGQGPNIYDVTTPANGMGAVAVAVAAVGYYNCGSIDGDDERPSSASARPTEAETNCCGSLRVHEGLPPVPARPRAPHRPPKNAFRWRRPPRRIGRACLLPALWLAAAAAAKKMRFARDLGRPGEGCRVKWQRPLLCASSILKKWLEETT